MENGSVERTGSVWKDFGKNLNTAEGERKSLTKSSLSDRDSTVAKDNLKTI